MFQMRLSLTLCLCVWLYGSCCAAQVRIERRREIREAQIRVGDREVYINEQGEKMSKLKVG